MSLRCATEAEGRWRTGQAWGWTWEADSCSVVVERWRTGRGAGAERGGVKKGKGAGSAGRRGVQTGRALRRTDRTLTVTCVARIARIYAVKLNVIAAGAGGQAISQMEQRIPTIRTATCTDTSRQTSQTLSGASSAAPSNIIAIVAELAPGQALLGQTALEVAMSALKT